MRIRKVIWWMAVILLLLGAIVCIIMVRQFGSTQFQQLGQLLTSIEQNPKEWEGIEIGGTFPLGFHKNLWIANGLMINFTTWSAVLFSLLTSLLFVTLLYERRKARKI
jgi:hypothetical protein